jgi:hypothetical protein
MMACTYKLNLETTPEQAFNATRLNAWWKVVSNGVEEEWLSYDKVIEYDDRVIFNEMGTSHTKFVQADGMLTKDAIADAEIHAEAKAHSDRFESYAWKNIATRWSRESELSTYH